MTVHSEIAALRAEVHRQTGERHLSADTADALNYFAGIIDRRMTALWDALEIVARAVDESRGSSVNSGS